MAVKPHALFSCLRADIADFLAPEASERIFSGTLDWPGITFSERAASSIYHSLLRKLESGMNNETKRAALNKFLSINDGCEAWRFRDNELPGDDALLGEFKALLWDFWHRDGVRTLVDHPYDILSNGGVGPGSGLGADGNDFYTKFFSSKLTCTSPYLYFWYKRYIAGFPEWSNAENTRLLDHGSVKIVEGNRLDFVPKNDDISRSICVEPPLNMFYQLGFGAILTERLEKYFGIDLKYQQFKNRELARIGSRDGSFATIDLSSASDSISLRMLQHFLPPTFYRWLVQLRSPMSRLPNGEQQALHMVSTMGNGFTFPLQTIIFACVVMSAFRCDGWATKDSRRKPGDDRPKVYRPFGVSTGNFGVNGDDIVVPTRIYPKVSRLLHLLGFQLNRDKTFVEGPFRESCGGDYFEGRNLRGVYVKNLSGPHDLYSAINQLNLFSTRTGILLKRTVQYLLARVKWRPVPLWENDSCGIKVPFAAVAKRMRVDRDTQSTLYYAWTSDPPPKLRIGDMVVQTPRGFKRRYYNPSGLHTSLLQGSVKSMAIALKPKVVRYRSKPRIAPNWDIPVQDLPETVHRFARWFVGRRWESATYMNLFM